MNTAIESICPNGWSLPSTKQIDSNRDVTNFSPVFGGNYINGALDKESALGVWWGSEAYNGAIRRRLRYGGTLSTDAYYRNTGYYIRCVSEEKTVTDLTYMQDIT